MRTKYHMTLKRRGKKSWRKKNRKPKLRYGISVRLKVGYPPHVAHLAGVREELGGEQAGAGGLLAQLQGGHSQGVRPGSDGPRPGQTAAAAATRSHI